MGNACGCADDKRTGEAKGQIKGIVGENPDTVYRIPGYQSKINPALFAGIPTSEKDAILMEAFRTLITTVEPEKIKSTNPYIRQFTSKTVGKCVNADGDEYEGEIVEGVANGKGKIRYRNGTVYEGMMFNGLKHGQGKITVPGPQGYSEPVECYNDNFIGVSTAKLNDGSDRVSGFDGVGQRTGPLMVTSTNGNTLYGTARNGLLEGMAVEINKARTEVQLKDFKAGNNASTKVFTAGNGPVLAPGAQVPPPVPATTTPGAPVPPVGPAPAGPAPVRA